MNPEIQRELDQALALVRELRLELAHLRLKLEHPPQERRP